MSNFASATFGGTQFTELSVADPNFSKQFGYTENLILGAGGAYVISNSNVGAGVYQHSGTPASADYTVAADITKLSGNTGNNRMGVCGRMQAGVRTMYFALYSHDLGNIRLLKDVAGTTTTLGTYTFTLTGTPARLLLRMAGNQISVELNGTQVIAPVTDTSITTAGKAGIYAFETRQTGVADAGSIDNFSGDNIGGGTNGTANGVTLTATASLIAGTAIGASGSTANGTTLTATASLITGGGTLNFQAAGMEFGRRTGLGINTFALDASQGYRYTVHADGLTLGAAIITSGVVATDSGGKLANLASTLLAPGTLYRVHAIRQADGEAATFRMRAQA
jgi:hypothetical protein